MRIPQLQIHTTDIKMDMNIQDARVKMTNSEVVQHIEQPAAQMEIHTTDGQLHIDSSQARRDIGMIGAFESVKNYAQKGKQVALEGVARRVKEGRQLLQSAGKGLGRDPIINIAKQNHGPKRPGPINIDFVPKYGSVKIDYTPGKVDVNITPQAPKIDNSVKEGNYDYTAGKVTNTMVQRPDVQIDVIG